MAGTSGSIEIATDCSHRDCVDYFTGILLHISGNYILAGGAIRSYLLDRPINDLDLFFRSQEELEQCKADMLAAAGPVTVYSRPSDLKIEWDGPPINLPRQYFRSPIELLRDFDISVCCAAICGGQLYHVNGYFEMLYSKTAKILNYTQHPMRTMIRIAKYQRLGFKFDQSEIQLVVDTINSRSLDQLAITQAPPYELDVTNFKSTDPS